MIPTYNIVKALQNEYKYKLKQLSSTELSDVLRNSSELIKASCADIYYNSMVYQPYYMDLTGLNSTELSTFDYVSVYDTLKNDYIFRDVVLLCDIYNKGYYNNEEWIYPHYIYHTISNNLINEPSSFNIFCYLNSDNIKVFDNIVIDDLIATFYPNGFDEYQDDYDNAERELLTKYYIETVWDEYFSYLVASSQNTKSSALTIKVILSIYLPLSARRVVVDNVTTVNVE